MQFSNHRSLVRKLDPMYHSWRPHVPQWRLKILHAPTKTQHKSFIFFKREGGWRIFIPHWMQRVVDLEERTELKVTSRHDFSTVYRYAWVSQVALVEKNLPANSRDVRDTGLIPGSRRSPGKRNGYPLQYSCLENSMDWRAWLATVYGVTKSWTRLSD